MRIETTPIYEAVARSVSHGHEGTRSSKCRRCGLSRKARVHS